MKCFAAWNDGPVPQRMDKSAREFGNLGVEVTALAPHPASDVVVFGDMEGGLTLFDPTQGEVIAKLNSHKQSVTRILFTRDGEHMVTTATDGAVIVWTGDGEAVHKTESTG